MFVILVNKIHEMQFQIKTLYLWIENEVPKINHKLLWFKLQKAKQCLGININDIGTTKLIFKISPKRLLILIEYKKNFRTNI